MVFESWPFTSKLAPQCPQINAGCSMYVCVSSSYVWMDVYIRIFLTCMHVSVYVYVNFFHVFVCISCLCNIHVSTYILHVPCKHLYVCVSCMYICIVGLCLFLEYIYIYIRLFYVCASVLYTCICMCMCFYHVCIHVKIALHGVQNSTLNKGEWSAPRPERFTVGKNSDTRGIEDWVF
jgi:hypothetical protein